MKRVMYGLTGVIVVFALVGCTTMGVGKKEAKEGLAQPGPTVMVATPMVKMSKKAKITIVGTGFQPGQEVSLLFTTAHGCKLTSGMRSSRNRWPIR